MENTNVRVQLDNLYNAVRDESLKNAVDGFKSIRDIYDFATQKGIVTEPYEDFEKTFRKSLEPIIQSTEKTELTEQELETVNGGFTVPVLNMKLDKPSDWVKITIGQFPALGPMISGSVRNIETFITGGDMGQAAKENIYDFAEDLMRTAGAAGGVVLTSCGVVAAIGCVAAGKLGPKVIDWIRTIW